MLTMENNMSSCPTKRIKFDNEQGFVLINESDFDPAKHTAYEERPSDAAPAKPVKPKKDA